MKKNFLRQVSILLSLTLVIAIFASFGTFYANAEQTEKTVKSDKFNYYRECDDKTGKILEKYDAILNGENNNYYSLATSMSESKTDRIAALNFIKSIYNKVNSSEQKILKSYVLSYAPYTNNIGLIKFCKDLNETKKSKSVETYSANDAVNYAYQYWQNYNPTYPDLNDIGGDCANFVSQCLFAGGKQMSGDWYIYQKNNTYMKPANTTQLNQSWDLADPSPWISAKEFNNYWSDYCTTYEYTLSNYESNHSSIYNSGNVKSGDVLLLLERVLWWYEGNHVMIIVGLDSTNTDFIYAGHSNDRIDGTILGNICDSYGSNYKIKFFSI